VYWATSIPAASAAMGWPPLILIERQAEGRVGPIEVEALHAARPGAQVTGFERLRHREREGEGGQGEVEAGKARDHAAEEVAGRQTHEAGGEDPRVGRHVAVAHQHRQRVGAEPVERAVAEGHQSGLARDQVEAEDGDRVRRREGQLVGPEAPQEERERERGGDEQRDGEVTGLHGAGPASRTGTVWPAK
jgi:hypothetical protein